MRSEKKIIAHQNYNENIKLVLQYISNTMIELIEAYSFECDFVI